MAQSIAPISVEQTGGPVGFASTAVSIRENVCGFARTLFEIGRPVGDYRVEIEAEAVV